MLITRKLLVDRRACHDAIDDFSAIWPDGAEPTVENLWIAYKAKLDVYWLRCFLPDRGPFSALAWIAWCLKRGIPLCSNGQVEEVLIQSAEVLNSIIKSGKSFDEQLFAPSFAFHFRFIYQHWVTAILTIDIMLLGAFKNVFDRVTPMWEDSAMLIQEAAAYGIPLSEKRAARRNERNEQFLKLSECLQHVL
jgi:hypothetical protein